MAAVPFCRRFFVWGGDYRGLRGWAMMPTRPFCSLCPIALGTSPLFRTWLGGGRGLRLNCGLRGRH